MISIEEGNPIPPKLYAGGRPSQYAEVIARMKVGDNVKGFRSLSEAKTFVNAMERAGYKAAVRTLETGEIKVWRKA